MGISFVYGKASKIYSSGSMFVQSLSQYKYISEKLYYDYNIMFIMHHVHCLL